MVVVGVCCTEDQCDSGGSGKLGQRRDGVALLGTVEFQLIASTKLVPFGRVMSEPCSECSRWSEILSPPIQAQGFLAASSRPQSIHEEAEPILGARCAVGAFEPDYGVSDNQTVLM